MVPAHGLLLAIVALSILLMLVRPHGVAEVWWISGGALLLLALRLIPLKLAAHAVAAGTDVYLFLLGMMLLSELAREHGVFDWAAATCVRGARGSSSRLFLLVYAVGTLITIFLSNDATAVVLTPAILAAVRKAKVTPLPYLFVCALIANAASFVLPISNPANLVVFHDHLPPLGRWLAGFALPSLLSILATYAVMRWLFRLELRAAIACKVEEALLRHDGRLVLGGLGLVIAVLLICSAFRLDLGLPTCIAAIAVAVAVSWRAHANPVRMLKEISWSTLLLVAGLFVLVEAVESVGALQLTQHWLQAAASLGHISLVLTGFAVGVSNNLVNNLPLGLIAGATLQAAHQQQGLLANAVLIGVDLGPNLSVTGSLATILWLLALRKGEVEVSGRQFLKVGMVAMPVALLAALGGGMLTQWLIR